MGVTLVIRSSTSPSNPVSLPSLNLILFEYPIAAVPGSTPDLSCTQPLRSHGGDQWSDISHVSGKVSPHLCSGIRFPNKQKSFCDVRRGRSSSTKPRHPFFPATKLFGNGLGTRFCIRASSNPAQYHSSHHQHLQSSASSFILSIFFLPCPAPVIFIPTLNNNL